MILIKIYVLKFHVSWYKHSAGQCIGCLILEWLPLSNSSGAVIQDSNTQYTRVVPWYDSSSLQTQVHSTHNY